MTSQPRRLLEVISLADSGDDHEDSSDTTLEFEGERSQPENSGGSDSDCPATSSASLTRRRRRVISSSDEEDPFVDQFDESQRRRLTLPRKKLYLESPRTTRRVRNLRRQNKAALMLLEKTGPQLRKRKFCWNEDTDGDDNDPKDERSLKKIRKSSITMKKTEKIQEMILKEKKSKQKENAGVSSDSQVDLLEKSDKFDEQRMVGVLEPGEARKVSRKEKNKKRRKEIIKSRKKLRKDAGKKSRKNSEKRSRKESEKKSKKKSGKVLESLRKRFCESAGEGDLPPPSASVDVLSPILSLPPPVPAAAVHAVPQVSSSPPAVSLFTTAVSSSDGRVQTVPGQSVSRPVPSPGAKTLPGNSVKPAVPVKSTGYPAPPTDPRKNPPIPRPAAKAVPGTSAKPVIPRMSSSCPVALPTPRPAAKIVPGTSAKPVVLGKSSSHPVALPDPRKSPPNPRPVAKTSVKPAVQPAAEVPGKSASQPSPVLVPTVKSTPAQTQPRVQEETNNGDQVEVGREQGRQKIRITLSRKSQNEVQLAAQRATASTENFFQSSLETNNTYNPFDQRKQKSVKIWFTPLSRLLRPDVLAVSAVSPPGPSPAGNQEKVSNNFAPLRELKDYSPNNSLYKEALGFLHDYLTSHVCSEPQSSSSGCLRLFLDYQRFLQQQRQSLIFPTDR